MGKTSSEGAVRGQRGRFHSSTSRVGEGAPQLLHDVFQAHADFLGFGFHIIYSGEKWGRGEQALWANRIAGQHL